MKKPIFNIIIFFTIIQIFMGCEEVTLSNPQTTDANKSTLIDTSDTPNIEDQPLINTQNSNKTLDDIVKIINTMDTTSNNEAQKTDILNWIEKVAIEVNELTNKNYISLIQENLDKELFYLGKNIYSTKQTLHIYDDGNPGYIGSPPWKETNIVIINKDANINGIDDSIILCTGDLNVSSSHNSIIVAKGTLNIGMDGVSENNKIIDGSIIYNKGLIEIAHSYDSSFLFAKHVQSSHIYGSDCINTGTTNSSHGQCNEITSTNLTEN